MVGHAIHNDFQALKYFHPKERTRDTSRIPLLNQRAGLPPGANASLKSLARHLLQKKIQVNPTDPGGRWGGSGLYKLMGPAWSWVGVGRQRQ